MATRAFIGTNPTDEPMTSQLPVIRPRSANMMRHIVASDGSHRRFSELAVFDARLYIRVRRIDEPAQLCCVCCRSRSQLHMAHELAGAFQQARRIPQPCRSFPANLNLASLICYEY